MSELNTILALKGITKIYPGVMALNNVTFELVEGEVHALVGENGAGKSTLIKTCAGAVTPDQGKIEINGKEYREMSPQIAQQNGIAVIYQEFNLVGELSVAENIFLGNTIRKGIVIDKPAMVEQSKKIFEQLNIIIDPDVLVKDLTTGYQQIVEIAKAISKNAKILIMDEPSAPLTNSEVDCMFRMIDKLKANGVTIIYISHRLEEIFRISDRVTIMRDGEKIKTKNTCDTDIDELVKLMVGRELKETYPPRKANISDEVLLDVKNLFGNGLADITFQVKRGEILGFAGLIGAGRTELAELIFGVRQKESGHIVFKGKEICPKSPRQAIDYGISLVPEDRKRQGNLLHMSIRENISMAILDKISKLFFIKSKKEVEVAEKYIEDLSIKTPSLEQLVKNLSGGNQQKVVLAKWLASNPDLIIFDEPTRGIDVGAKHEIYKLMNKLLEMGKTIIMISSEMEELMGMVDKIIVLAEGKISGEILRNEFNQELIMSYASKNLSKGVHL
jgi:ribose transport system ATP-binding protein